MYFIGLVPSKYFGVFDERDYNSFLTLTLRSCGFFVAASTVSV